MDLLHRVPVSEAKPEERILNFEEVCLGYSEEEAVSEATRCLNCPHPACVEGCPVSVNIPAFIEAIKNKEFDKAIDIIGEASCLPAVCGRVCPQEVQCEARCVRGIKGDPIAIGKLERFAADRAIKNGYAAEKKTPQNGHRVAVIGSGPSGLSCAGDLAKMGYEVTVFEALHQPGGVLTYGIPEFRLPKEKVVLPEIQKIRSLGVHFELNTVVGRTLPFEDLEKEGFEAVFIGSGAGLPMFMGIPGENAPGVISANEFLTRVNLMKAYREDYDTPVGKPEKAIVVGGGNVAMDAARTVRRLGAETHIVYRRGRNELPARKEELLHAEEEGILFDLLTNPTEILTDESGRVTGVRLIRMELGEPDASGRRRPVEIPGSEFVMEADTVIMALGTSPNPLLQRTVKGLRFNARKCIIVEEESGKTSLDGVYAGGDAVTGAATVLLAMESGRRGAKSIDRAIREKMRVEN